jgi:hypothetical protein
MRKAVWILFANLALSRDPFSLCGFRVPERLIPSKAGMDWYSQYQLVGEVLTCANHDEKQA